MTTETEELELFNDPELDKDHPNETFLGTQKLYRFDNGYGASVVRGRMADMGDFFATYTDADTWELAVIKFNSNDVEDFNLTYDTPITDDVIGHLSDQEVEEILHQIRELPEKEE
jgi:hypothetical protein